MRHPDAARRSDEFDRPQRASCLEARLDELGLAEKAAQADVVRLAERLPGAAQPEQLQVGRRQQAARPLERLVALAAHRARLDESELQASAPRALELPALDGQPEQGPPQQTAQQLDAEQPPVGPLLLQARRPAQLAAAMGLPAVDRRARLQAVLAQEERLPASPRAHSAAGQRDA